MNYELRYHLALSYLVIVILTLSIACQQVPDIPSPSEITKTQRTHLGQDMKEIILDNDLLNVLPKDEYASNYRFVQNYYDQAYFAIRKDWSAAADDQWNSNRIWEVHISQSDERFAFCLPGGDFFVSTGLLKALNFESELYYIMSFELTIMKERHLISKLVSYANNSADLIEIIETGISSSDISLEDLVNKFLEEINYTEDGTVQEIDQETNRQICKTSLFDRMSIQGILAKLDTDDTWLSTRPSYPNRVSYLRSEFEFENQSDCGNKRWSNNSSEYTLFINSLP